MTGRMGGKGTGLQEGKIREKIREKMGKWTKRMEMFFKFITNMELMVWAEWPCDGTLPARGSEVI